jgi:hypothetical protein
LREQFPLNFFTEVRHLSCLLCQIEQVSSMTDGDYTIVSNLSSFFTLRRDAISNAKKTPASSVASKNQTNQENDMWKTPVACEDNNRLHICLKDDFIIWRIGE